MPLIKPPPRREHLTGRELQVCLLISNEALRDKQIAERLDLSTHTVRNYLGNIFMKLRIDSREKLIIWAYRNRLSGITPLK